MSGLKEKINKALVMFKEHGCMYTLNRIYCYCNCRLPHINIHLRSDLTEYIDYVEKLNIKLRRPEENDEFVNITKSPHIWTEDDNKIIAWYLPQYYEIEVNNKYHGKGFTEWTNSTRSIPLFKEHNQPQIPYDVGYYNLTMMSTLKRQVELANMYAVYGFCFDYYWFSGERTMEKPVELFLKNKNLNTHFCINWCMENWSQKWDGGKKGLIYELKIQEGDAERFMNDLLPYLKDDRYILVSGKPLLMFYMYDVLSQDQFKKLLTEFRSIAKKAGFPDLYVMLCTTTECCAEEWGGDAIVEYPTYNLRNCPNKKVEGYLNPNFKSYGGILDYEKFVEKRLYWKEYDEKNIYRSALTNFDNSPRKAYSKNCWITYNSTPELYKKWLIDILDNSVENQQEKLTFVLAWNEWAESAHLEPDWRYGYAYLQATKEAVERKSYPNTSVINQQVINCHDSGIENIEFYIHCIESMGDVVACEPIARYLKTLDNNCKVVWIVKRNLAEIVKYNKNIDEIVEVSCLGESIEIIKEKNKFENNIIINCHYDGRWCPITGKVNHNRINPQVNEKTYLNYGALLTNFCLTAGLPALTDAPIFHFSSNVALPDNIPAEYIVIHCKSAEEIKDWSFDKWKKLVKHITNAGYNVVEIGLNPYAKINNIKYHDFTSVHNIQQIAKIIERAKLFIGVDSGFAHIANCLGVKGILLFGKYKNFQKSNMYTGKYAEDDYAEIIFASNGGLVTDISVEEVKDKIVKYL